MHLSARYLMSTLIVCCPLLVFAIDPDYIIFPVDNLDETDVQAVTEILSKYAGGSKNVYASERPWSKAPAYWIAKLPSSAIDIIRNAKGVCMTRPKHSIELTNWAR